MIKMGTSSGNGDINTEQTSSVGSDLTTLIQDCFVNMDKKKSKWDVRIKSSLAGMLLHGDKDELLKIGKKMERMLIKETEREATSSKRCTQVGKAVTDILRSLKLMSVIEDSLKFEIMGTVLIQLIAFVSKKTSDDKVTEEANKLHLFVKSLLDFQMGSMLTVLLASCDAEKVGNIDRFLYQLLRLTVQDVHSQQLEKGIEEKVAVAGNVLRINSRKHKEKYRKQLVASWKAGKNNGLMGAKNVGRRIKDCQRQLSCLSRVKKLKGQNQARVVTSEDLPVEWELSSKPDNSLKYEENDDDSVEDEANSGTDSKEVEANSVTDSKEDEANSVTDCKEVEANSVTDSKEDEANSVTDSKENDADNPKIGTECSGSIKSEAGSDDNDQNIIDEENDDNDNQKSDSENGDNESSDDEFDLSEDGSNSEHSEDSDLDSDSDNEVVSKRAKLA